MDKRTRLRWKPKSRSPIALTLGLLIPLGMMIVGPVPFGLVAFGLVASRTAAAQQPKQAIADYVAAGEFGPALRSAEQIKDTDVRDRMLTDIALAQAQVGARQASMSTLLGLHSDLVRQQAATDLGDRPIGAGGTGGASGAGGGAAMADFDTLIELITSTIAPDSWDEVGGAGAIESFPTGVYVDTDGVMKRVKLSHRGELFGSAREDAVADTGNRDVHLTSSLRKVSLVRLERHIQLLKAFGRVPNEDMLKLAGIYRVKYLFVYPDTGDIVIAGPAGDWRTDAQGRVVNTESGTPVLQLDDFVTLLRNAYEQHGRMGCAIKPRQKNLAAAKSFAESWSGKAVRPSARERWVGDLRKALGKQDIDVWGIDARTHAARILVEADYHMKLVGMGLEEGTLGVVSYLDALKDAAGERELPMSVLRWWFTLNYDGVRTAADRHAFQLDGTGVRVLSENEMLTERGERVHTGKSDLLNAEFAHSFTNHFETLSDKYPVYAELRNIFDMALLSAIIRAEDLPGQVDWHMTHFMKSDGYLVHLSPAPREVETIVNTVNVSSKRFLVGVSGGVSVDTNAVVSSKSIEVDNYGLMDAAHGSAAPELDKLPRDVWWWD